jgi:hypothetical protein|tara:strand:+ start:1288 stop:1716 length:429 start_codon:yes stop_codon:yes gene_type:complete
MNIVEVTGGNAKEREVVLATVYYCIRALMPRMRTLDIEVKLYNIKRAYGYCEVGVTRREFEISIKRGLKVFDLISTVCHEMVHVKQYARNELGHDKNGEQLWRASPDLPSDTDYHNTPWEVEAFTKELQLSLEFFHEMDVKF